MNSWTNNMIATKKFDFGSWKPKVLVTRKSVPEFTIKYLQEYCEVLICKSETRKEILEKVPGVDGLFWAFSGLLNKEILDAAGDQLKVISVTSAGIEYVDLEEVKKRKILLGHLPNISNDSVAETGIGLALAAGRRFHEARLNIDSSTVQIRFDWMLGQDLKNSTIGIVGFGGIGSILARKLQGFDVKEFLYCGHNKKLAADEMGAKFVSFDELCRKSDFIFIICPLTSETKHMFNKETFSKMKPTSVLVNIARGEIVDQEALYDALSNKIIFAAGLDVTTPEPLPADHPLLTLPNCIILPHIATATATTRHNMVQIAALNLLCGLSNEPLYNSAY